MTDIERAAFEEWFEVAIKPKMNGTTAEFMTKEIMFAGWQARAFRPVAVTDEMVEDGAKALYGQRHPIDYWHETASTQRGDDYRLNARRVLSAALNGGTD